MKKPKDVAELATRLAGAASTPLVAPAPDPAPAIVERAVPVAKRAEPKRTTVPVFLRISKDLYGQYDGEAMRRTKETGRGVTVQQVIIDKLAGAGA